MATAADVLYVDSHGGGRRFCIHHRPQGGVVQSAVVFVHAFAEEMNKSRRMVAMTARALADAGHAVLLVDLHGCGDSEGRLDEASWTGWLDDVRAACDWLCGQHPGAPLVLWGQRAGALLATAVAKERAAAVLLWQPPTQGKLLLQQFMRMKLAATLQRTDGEATTGGGDAMRAMRAAWQRGECVEIGGYNVPPSVATGLESATLQPPTGPARSAWIEVGAREPLALLPASAALAERWRAAGHRVETQAVAGPAFWQTVEIEDAPELVPATVAAMRSLVDNPAGVGRPGPAGALTPPTTPAGAAELPLWIDCEGERLLAVVGRPAQAHGPAVLIVVGGPQYRAGAHRQFVQLARALNAAGHPTMRFDVRGMGDATGPLRNFESIEADVVAARTAFESRLPAGTPIVLWGLCDGASAALMAVGSGQPAAGLVLANPWVRSAQTLARTHVKHYYRKRLLEREFWLKLLRGGVGQQAIRGLLDNLRLSRRTVPAGAGVPADFRLRMAHAAARFDGPTLLLLSELDLTAREFEEFTARDAAWQAAWQRHPPQRVSLAGADHTFSSADAEQAAAQATIAWLRRFEGATR